jgi:predicted nucleic acid-binding protein
MKKIEDGDIFGFVDEFVLNEVLHKLMITAIVNRFHCAPHEAIAIVKHSPSILADLPHLWEASDLLQRIDVTCIPGPLFPKSLAISREWNLFATDAVHVAAMKKEQISCIATNDADFSRISFLQLFRPVPTDAPA